MIKTITKLAGMYLNTMSYVMPKTAAKQGLRLFCRPMRAPLKDYQKKFLNSADLFSFIHDGVTIQAYRWGTGERKILFLHGWQSHTFRWKAYIESLSKDDYSIYSLDAPGHGLSTGSYLSVPYYSGVIQHLIGTLGPIHAIVSHSLGSFSALHAFHQQPSLPIKKLVLLAPPGQASDFFAFYKQKLTLSERAAALILSEFENQFQNRIEYFSTVKFAGEISIPGLIIHDEGDDEAPYHYAQKINQMMSNSILVTTKGLGHNLKSKEVIEKIIQFLSIPTYQSIMEVK